MKSTVRTKKMVESALMVALSTILSLFNLVQMPYGGSVTPASLLPIVLVAYRHGALWGFGAGLVHGVVQQLLGLNNLSYFTTWQSIVAIILLDYLLAFAAGGLGGVFRRSVKTQSISLVCGGALACLVRYACHVISGATVWAGLSIPTEAALAYSLIYNATYMIPETVVLLLVAYYLGSVLDFRREQPVRLAAKGGARGADACGLLAGGIGVAALAVVVSLVFSHMQHAETGEFDIAGLRVPQFAGSFWMAVVLIAAISAVVITALLITRRYLLKKAKTAEK